VPEFINQCFKKPQKMNTDLKSNVTTDAGIEQSPMLPAVWADTKGRQVIISSMSDYWLNNVRKKFKGEDRQKIQPIMDEIKRRKKIRSLPNGR